MIRKTDVNFSHSIPTNLILGANVKLLSISVLNLVSQEVGDTYVLAPESSS